MTAQSREEVLDHLNRGLAGLEELDRRNREEILEAAGWVELLYEPSTSLLARLQDYFEWREGGREEDAGRLMEEIALLLFKSLKGVGNIRSFQSYAPQHDLVVDGSSVAWQTLMLYLHLPRDGRSVVVEAKNQNPSISDQQFSRLCGILQNKFASTAHLGVFVSRTRASGFPEPTDEATDEPGGRERNLRNARATQALFHSKTGKFVVVVCEQHLQLIADGMPFPRLLEARIREVEAASGMALSFDEDWREVDLPSHLSKYMEGS